MTDRIADFFAFARERHAIYLRRRQHETSTIDPSVLSPEAQARVQGIPGPWTGDPILQQYRFTNVFRELDKTTVWFREHVREPLRDRPEVLLATVLFRWFNRITTGEAIFSQQSALMPNDHHTAWDCRGWLDPDLEPAQQWINDYLRPAILNYCGSGPYVTGAYIIKTPDGYSKLDGVLQCVRWFMEQSYPVPGASRFLGGEPLSFRWQGAAEAMLSTADAKMPWTLESAWCWLRQFPFLGDFMAYEIVTDLRHTALLDRAPDIMTWANPGPGATRGLGRIFCADKDKFNQHRHKDHLIELMQQLLEESRDAGYWPQALGSPTGEWVGYSDNCEYDHQFQTRGDWPEWEMREVEHTLCEFDKYERVRTGEGRPRGRFR